MVGEKESHLERTSHEPRGTSLHDVELAHVHKVNDSIRIFRLEIPHGGQIKFLPGQWLDTYLPGVPKAGGFTITSPPSAAIAQEHGGSSRSRRGYIELAVQRSPDNPAAQWLWQPPDRILGSTLRVRVGGSFVWPPPGISVSSLQRVIFVAGGVGVNPLVSMLSHLAETQLAVPASSSGDEGAPGLSAGCEVHFLYTLRDPGPGKREVKKMLFLERIAGYFAENKVKGRLCLFLTSGGEAAAQDAEGKEPKAVPCNGIDIPHQPRRITVKDIALAVGAAKQSAVVYICGVPTMTDSFVEQLTSPDGLGLEPHRVLFEKWW